MHSPLQEVPLWHSCEGLLLARNVASYQLTPKIITGKYKKRHNILSLFDQLLGLGSKLCMFSFFHGQSPLSTSNDVFPQFLLREEGDIYPFLAKSSRIEIQIILEATSPAYHYVFVLLLGFCAQTLLQFILMISGSSLSLSPVAQSIQGWSSALVSSQCKSCFKTSVQRPGQSPAGRFPHVAWHAFLPIPALMPCSTHPPVQVLWVGPS